MTQEKPEALKAYSFKTPIDLYRALRHVWASDTASPAGTWSSSNPALNHCSITSLVVQDFFGGEILTTKTVGGTHFYNAIDGTTWDLTASQFAEPIPYDGTPSSRAMALSDTSTEKYERLKERLNTQLAD